MKVEVLTGVPGCGKSTTMRREALATPGHYLFAMPTIALIQEQAEAFREDADRQNIRVDVTEVHSQSKDRKQGAVAKRLTDSAVRIARDGVRHAVVLITHETLMGHDLSGFSGWHARIDEAPNALQSDIVDARSAKTREFFSTNFKLSQVTNGWAEVERTEGEEGWRDRIQDNLLKNMSEFLKQASRPLGVFVDTLDWSEKKFGWCSIWSPIALAHFQSVQVAGAAYLSSLGALVVQKWQNADVQFTERSLRAERTGQPAIRIHYFTQGHEGTSHLWESSPGREMIVKLCDHLAKTEPKLGFWSANTEVQKLMEHRVHGGPIDPKVAGINAYDHLTSCAFIYSAKPTDGDKPIKNLFGITDDQIRTAREDEDILQFAMRGAVRKPFFDESYDIYLYSLRQAVRLKEQLAGSGVGSSITLVPETAAGIMQAVPVQPKPATQSSSERGKKAAQRMKDRRRANALAAGRAPGGKGGRPRKAKLYHL